ncbi:unnamed protein product, partial [Nesidiocoris tenuis]
LKVHITNNLQDIIHQGGGIILPEFNTPSNLYSEGASPLRSYQPASLLGMGYRKKRIDIGIK